MKLNGETKLFLGIILGTLAIIVFAVFALARPAPTYTRAELIPEGTITRGNPNADVFLVEFSDFQCPACKAAKPVIDDILKSYGDRILFAYRHFPLEQHPFSQKAASTAETAQAQGKFWDMYDLLFLDQEGLSDTLVASYASQLKIDPTILAQDLAQGTYQKKIDKDRQAGVRFGVNSTPTFFLNGKKLELASFADIKTEVEKALQK